MIGYFKSLLAVCLAGLVVSAAGFWLRDRLAVRTALQKESDALRREMAQAESRAALKTELERRLEVLRRDRVLLAKRFAKRDQCRTQLMQRVVNACLDAGLEMTAAAETTGVRKLPSAPPENAPLRVVAYKFTLKGPYVGLVKFLQSAAAWEVQTTIESVMITPHREDKTGQEITAALVLSILAEG